MKFSGEFHLLIEHFLGLFLQKRGDEIGTLNMTDTAKTESGVTRVHPRLCGVEVQKAFLSLGGGDDDIPFPRRYHPSIWREREERGGPRLEENI